MLSLREALAAVAFGSTVVASQPMPDLPSRKPGKEGSFGELVSPVAPPKAHWAMMSARTGLAPVSGNTTVIRTAKNRKRTATSVIVKPHDYEKLKSESVLTPTPKFLANIAPPRGKSGPEVLRRVSPPVLYLKLIFP